MTLFFMQRGGLMQIQRILQLEYQQPSAGFLHCGSSHSHWELCYCVSGTVHAVVEGYDLALSPGQMVLCAPEQFHMLYAQDGQAPSFLTAIFDGEGIQAQPLLCRVLCLEALSPALACLVQEHQSPDGFSQQMSFHVLSLIMLALCRAAGSAPAAPVPARPQRGENDIIRRAQQHICNHIRKKLSVTLVAKRIDVSPSYMTALFHKHLAISPGEYIRRAKLEESKRLIQEGAMNFTEIAAALEYSTVHHFSRQFKEHFGMTPTEYAKRIGAKGA